MLKLPREVPAAGEKIFDLAENYRQLDLKVQSVLDQLYAGTYPLDVPPGVYDRWVSDVPNLVITLNEYTRSIIHELLQVLERAFGRLQNGSEANFGVITTDTMQLLEEAGLGSYTPNILDPDYLYMQDDIDFYPGSLQNNPQIVTTAQAIAIYHFHRGDHTSFADMPDAHILYLLTQIMERGAMKDIDACVQNYVQAFYDIGYTDLFILKELTDHLQTMFADMTEIMRRTMGGLSNDLFNNIFSTRAAVLSVIAEELVNLPEVKEALTAREFALVEA